MKIMIVTGCNEAHAPLIRGLVGSLSNAGILNEASLGVLDVGLSPQTRSWLAQYNATMVVPEWDLPIHPDLRLSKPHLRALTARPFLPKYFPGYDIYMWMDSDTWIQRKEIFYWYITAAQSGSIAITPQMDRLYRRNDQAFKWRRERMEKYFGKTESDLFNYLPYANSGVFALQADALHWQGWAKCFKAGLEATDGLVVSDQTALNWLLWQGKMSIYPLPAICNWLCHLSRPIYDYTSGLLYEQLLPHQELGIIHMTAESKDFMIKFRDGEGKIWQRGLRYDSCPELVATVDAIETGSELATV